MHSHSPRVGIFYVIGVELYVESMPMIEGEDWGDFKTYPNGHMEYWAVLTKRHECRVVFHMTFTHAGG
jgi:hypothetical protein